MSSIAGAPMPTAVPIATKMKFRTRAFDHDLEYRLLQSLRKIHGAAQDGSVDDRVLRTWVSSVREL